MHKRTWVMLLFGVLLLTFSTGTHNDGTSFSCSGSGTGTCVGDLCD